MKILLLKKRYKLLAVLILLISIALFAAPRIGRWYLVKHSRELLGRKISIDRIRINYFTGTLAIYELKLYEHDGKTVFLSFNRLKINLDYIPLFRNEIFIKYILLDDPYARIVQNGNKFNFSDLMKADSIKTRADTLPSKPLRYIINNIRISRGFMKYTDQALNHTISMNRIDLDIPGFTWNSDSTKLGLNFRFVDGGRLFSDLDIKQADSTYIVNVKLDSMNLDIIEPYVASYLNISAIHGSLTNDIRIKGDMRSIMKMTISGMNRVHNFELRDSLGRKILASDDVMIDIGSLLVDKNTLQLNSIELNKPYIFFERIDTSNNWLKLLKPSAETAADTAHNGAQPGSSVENPFSFSNLKIIGGTLEITDRSIRYPFVYTIDNIALAGYADKKRAGWIDINMKAGLNKAGTLEAEMAYNPDNFNELDISLSVNQFIMKDAEPYFRHYLGFPVTGGRMNFKSTNQMRISSLISNNSIYFRKFTLGKKTGEKTEYNIPLRLALGVMSDKDGIIDLKAPVEMKGENIKVGNVRKIIFRTIGNLFIKAAVSPVNMIGQLFNADPEKLKEIRLQPDDASPDKDNLETIDILADILNKKPGLDLDIIYCLNNERASDTLAYLMTLEEYRKATKISSMVPDSTLGKYISDRIPADTTSRSLNIMAMCRRYIGPDKLTSRMDSLKSARIIFLQNYLNRDKVIAAERFRITSSMPDTIRFDGPVPVFRTYFTAGEEKP